MSIDSSYHLDKDELDKFQTLGFAGPFQLIEPEEVGSLTKDLAREKAKFFFLNRILSRLPGMGQQLPIARWGKAKWHKGIHAVSPKVHQVSAEPAITDRVASIIGENIILWGSLMLTVKPSDKPSWHVDAECRGWDLFEGASVWLALSDVDQQSCMRVVTRSHNLMVSPEELKHTGLNIYDDGAVLEAVRQFEPESECVSVDTKPGEFFIFARHLWHTGGKGSKTRNSLLLQYSQPTSTVRKPLTFNPPIRWDSRTIPCTLVRGEHQDRKVLVAPPK